MKILVLGAGAIGSLLGARLALAGQQVILVGRPGFVQAVQAHGLVLIGPTGAGQAAQVAAAGSVAAAQAAYGCPDLVLLTVKAYDTNAAVSELSDADVVCPIVTLQNGIGNEEALAAAFGAERVLSGAIDTPVSVPAAGQVQVHRGVFRIGLAPVGAGASLDAAGAALAGAGFAVSRFADYQGLKWTKLLMNVLANASCAILDWTPAQVMAEPRTARLEARAWQEALAVMAGLRIQPVTLAGYPFPLFLPLARRLPAAWLARGLRSFVSGGRGSKMPSLHIALGAGKPSEVGWLNGAVARYGRELGLCVPVNTLFDDLLTALTAGQASRAAYRDRPDQLASLLP